MEQEQIKRNEVHKIAAELNSEVFKQITELGGSGDNEVSLSHFSHSTELKKASA